MSDCVICFEAFNRSTRKPICCANCAFSVCRQCVIRNMEENPSQISCMGCSQIWSRQFLCQVMTKSFMNKDFKMHRENVLFDQQRAFMESTLPFVESVKRKRKLVGEMDSLYNELDNIHAKIRKVNTEIDKESRFFNRGTRSSTEEPEEERIFSRGHCIKEDCNGLINNKWRCSSCELRVCNRCMKERDEDHVCLREDIESMRLIRSDSKPCPSCGVRIHLFEGCNQAWCTQCNTAFNWRTGKLIRGGFFHNPHYAEWQELNGGDPGAVSNYTPMTQAPCVNFNDIRARVIEELGMSHVNLNSTCRFMRGFLMSANHIMDTETNVRLEEFEFKLRQLRTSFLMNELDQVEFKVAVQRVDKAAAKRRELSSVFEMYATVAREILAKWASRKEISIEECRNEIDELYSYTKESVKNIHKYYQPFSKHNGHFINNIMVRH